MEVLEVEAKYYDSVFLKPYHNFNIGAFNSLNQHKCDKVFYLVFKDSKVRLGIILGLKEGILNSPFSAPFGGFQYINEDIGINQIDASLIALDKWVVLNQFRGLKIVFPPVFYNINFLTKIHNCLYRGGFEQVNLDVNYQFPTYKLDENYFANIWYNARKNLKKGINANLSFEKLEDDNFEIAYRIIEENRKLRGFPLRMTWEEVKETTSVFEADFFVVRKDSIEIASAIVFHVAVGIVQVVYWGDLPQFSEYKTMNFLSYELFKYYKESGIKVIDIGPSTENSNPNNGLCEFKESIGCDLSSKFSFSKIYDLCL